MGAAKGATVAEAAATATATATFVESLISL